MAFILIALILNASTGETLGQERIQSFPTPEACIAQMTEGRIERAEAGKVRAYQCVREDQLGETHT